MKLTLCLKNFEYTLGTIIIVYSQNSYPRFIKKSAENSQILIFWGEKHSIKQSV